MSEEETQENSEKEDAPPHAPPHAPQGNQQDVDEDDDNLGLVRQTVLLSPDDNSNSRTSFGSLQEEKNKDEGAGNNIMTEDDLKSTHLDPMAPRQPGQESNGEGELIPFDDEVPPHAEIDNSGNMTVEDIYEKSTTPI